MPHLFGQNLGIADDNHSVLGTRQGHVQPSWIVEEPNALVLVGAHASEDDVVLFATLERIDAGNFQFFVQLRPQRPVVLQVLAHIGALAFVRRDDTNVGGLDAALEKLPAAAHRVPSRHRETYSRMFGCDGGGGLRRCDLKQLNTL